MHSLGNPTVTSSATPEVLVSATPYRGTGRSQGEDYFGTPRYKGFDRRVRDRANGAKISLKQIEKVSGVWAGGKEPSTQITLTGPVEDVQALMDDIGSRYNQDAVMSFTPGEGGNAIKYVSYPPPAVKPAELAAAITKINAEISDPDRQIQGATVFPDASLAVVDVGGKSTEAVVRLVSELKLRISPQRGQAEMRYRGVDY